MQIQVRFFATLRDRAGIEQTEITLDDPATVNSLLDHLADAYPALKPSLSSTLVAVNQEYAFPEEPLNEGDEIALFPPVSGGAGNEADWPEYFAITADELDVNEILAHITRPETGGVCMFTGAVRGITRRADGEKDTTRLLYEAYGPMAQKKLEQVAREIRERFPQVQGIAIVQRTGQLEVGETTVLVACSSGHRNDGIFEAAHFGINRLKEIVPVWKKEIGPDGSEWVEGSYHPTPNDIEDPPA